VHKSQGLTIPKVYYTYGDADQSAGQTFVAMSRVRRFRDLCTSDTFDTRLLRLERGKAKPNQQLGKVFACWEDRMAELKRIAVVSQECAQQYQKRRGTER
jgi:hypothetical protein